jgi:hypothetical protein
VSGGGGGWPGRSCAACDRRRHAAERPRLIVGGIAVGVLGAVGSGLVVLVVGLFLLALSQYRWA